MSNNYLLLGFTNFKRLRMLAAFSLAALLSACPPSNDPPTPNPPTTDVGPAITLQPANQSVTAPATATFTSTASGTPTPTLQWQLSTDGVSFSNVAGATSSSYTTAVTSVTNSGNRFRVEATNRASSATSNIAVLTVTASPTATATLPAITVQPVAQSVTEPATATFSITATGTPTPTYQWQLSTDGTNYANLAGASTSSYSTGATTVAQTGYRYRVVVTNAVTSVTSDSASLSVTGTVASGATIVFSRNNGNVNVQNMDLYSIREVGGTEIQLTNSTDTEGSCGVTPTGRLVYQRAVTGGSVDIYSVNLDGTDTRPLAVTSDDEICVKIVQSGPAAGRVIYRRQTASGNRDLYAINADGTAPTPLATGPENEDFAALTENYRVIYNVERYQNTDMYSVDLQGLSVVPLATSGDYESYSGSVAGLVVYGRYNFVQTDLYTVGELGVGTTALAASPTADEDLKGITPGGAFIIYSRDRNSSNHTLYANSIPLVSGTDDYTYVGSTATGIFYLTTDVRGNADLHYIHVDGTGDVALANSADSEGFVFATNTGKAIYERYAITGSTVTLGDVYAINVDGTGLTTLAASVDHESFAAQIGNLVLIKNEIANSVNNIQLWAVNLDGTNYRRFFTPGGPAFLVGSTPSGRVIVRNLNQTGGDLYVVEPNGTGARVLATNAFLDAVAP
jgi:hypothetical protein